MSDSLRPDFRLRQLRRELRKLLPSDKNDVESVHSLVARGYPAVEPIILDILKWIRQPGWPVSGPIAHFLRQIGSPLIPHIQKVFGSDDDCWKAAVVRDILQDWPKEDVAPLAPYLEQLATHGQFGWDLEALRLIVRHRLVDSSRIASLLASKRRFHLTQLSEIGEMLLTLSK